VRVNSTADGWRAHCESRIDEAPYSQELDSHRDRASSLALELEDVRAALDAKEREIEELLAELDEREQVHQEELGKVADEWRDEVEDAREREREARQVRATSARQVGDLALILSACAGPRGEGRRR
jgi:chromosome segregation ATPase